MRAGRVINLRIRPKDCMTVVDLAETLNLPKDASFSHAAAIAFHALCQLVRDNKLVPDRDGFEYNQMMARFPASKKLTPAGWRLTQHFSTSEEWADDALDTPAPTSIALTKPARTGSGAPPVVPPIGTPERIELDRKTRRLKELRIKQKGDPMNFGQVELEEYVELQQWLIERNHDPAAYL